MIHAYSDVYLNSVMRNLAALFDIAINAEGIDADTFAIAFTNSRVARGIEAGNPKYLVGKSATEMLMEIIDREVKYTVVPVDRTPEYWAGWILAYGQWYLDKPFTEIISVMPLSSLISMYYPYHEADEMKTIEKIQERFPSDSVLKIVRKKRKLTQEQLAQISGVNIRSIRAYEQDCKNLAKAQSETLQLLAKSLNCSMEELLN